ncbi:MAG: aminotransferase class IV [Planctomycetota bacterium]
MARFVCLNGDIVERGAAKVSAFDRSFLYGDGLFETVRAYGGVPFMLAEHLARMASSAKALDITMPGAGGIAAAVERLIELNELADAYVRITLSRGIHTGELAPDEPPEPTLLIEARKLHPYPAEMYERGARVIISSFVHNSASAISRHKTTSYLASILAKREAKERGADEAILLDHAGHVAEGATSNVFCVRGGRLLTPPLDMNILPGITRRTVIKLAREGGIEVEETRFGASDLASADEAFLTNSLMEAMPAGSIDGGEPGHVPGPVTSALANAYEDLVASSA